MGSEEASTIRSKLSDIRKVEEPIVKLTYFSQSSNFISVNRMLVLGEWGTGKTHLLCDIVKNRINRKLPTLFFLAQHFQDNLNPLDAICETTKIASNQKELLTKLNKLGKDSNTRTLLIFDGVNESNKESWKKYMGNIISLVKKYPNVGLVLSCRTPFNKQIFIKSTESLFSTVYHNGFREIEFNAQRVFFKYYNIPNPHMPLLTPEFSKPLFLKILCSTFAGKTMTTKKRLMNEFTSGQKTIRKLLEDFVREIGSKIERDLGLSSGTCWFILKGQKITCGKMVGLSVSMANNLKEYLTTKECMLIIKLLVNKSNRESKLIFKRMISEGLLVEDYIWENRKQIFVIRLPYQRFSDHLVSMHLINQHLDISSESSIRRSFFKNKPLGKIFEIDKFGRSYKMPGLASAIMLEFPERVKNILPQEKRELFFYLPKKLQILSPLNNGFLEGTLWRDKNSFSKETDILFGTFLNNSSIERETFEILVCLACRTNHPYSAEKLYGYLSKMRLVERDLHWSEFLRNSHNESVVYRVLNWVDDYVDNNIDFDTANNMILLLSLFLTTTDRNLRDRATKALVIIGELQPKALFDKTAASLNFNDPYVSERMLAASYGVLMRSWAFPNSLLVDSINDFSKEIYNMMFLLNAKHKTTHMLSRDYALGILTLAKKINSKSLKGRSLKDLEILLKSYQVKIPSDLKIKEDYCKAADSAIHMDFGNYTIGHLVSDRQNYDYNNIEYKKVLKQIKWRILDLGYDDKLFEQVDRSISENSYYRSEREEAGKVDRYGKKYSWIAYFEIAGVRSDLGLLSGIYEPRISGCDIDPSFPEKLRSWKPNLNEFFTTEFISPEQWISSGEQLSYDHIFKMDRVDGLVGPWVLLGGYISEYSEKDPRKIFTFVNGVLAKSSNMSELEDRFKKIEYPGNHAIPGPRDDYYTFAGEIPWSNNYGYGFDQERKSKRYIAKCFEDHKSITTRKKVSDLSESEKFALILRSTKFEGFDSLKEKTKEVMENLPEFVEIPSYIKIPGIDVEVPIHSLSWEGHHSAENQSGGADFLAPALCNFLNLRNKSDHQDLFDANGKQASIFRVFSRSRQIGYFPKQV